MLTELRGVNFCPASAKEIVKSLEIGDELTLVRDPTNPYDDNAIKVIHDESEEFIGFVAKEDAILLAAQMDEGQEFNCSVESRTGTLGLLLSIESTDLADDDAAFGTNSPRNDDGGFAEE